MKIIVLMSSYNGEKYIREQIDSILAQDIAEDNTLELLVRDDGSTDSTQTILEEYSQDGRLKWYSGQNLRTARSFWQLIGDAPEADYYAFADQDDFWLEDKLSRAVGQLEAKAHKHETIAQQHETTAQQHETTVRQNKHSIPLLYCSHFTPTDEKLDPIAHKAADINNYTDFYHSLLYSTAPGCTFVFNRAARNIMIRYRFDADCLEMHDWLAHKIVALFGKVILDRESRIYYRQHSDNVIGIGKTTGFAGFLLRLKGFIRRDTRNIRSENAKYLYETYKQYFRNRRNARFDVLHMLAFYREDRNLKKQLLRSKCFATDGISYPMFKLLVIMNMI